MSLTDDQIADMVSRNVKFFAAYQTWSAGQVMLLAGTVDDPNSFDANGGKTGALGYYPVVNVNGQTIYVACIARLKEIALGGANAETLAQILGTANSKLALVDQATAEAAVARDQANAQAAYALNQGDYAKAQAQAIGDISAAVAAATAGSSAAQAALQQLIDAKPMLLDRANHTGTQPITTNTETADAKIMTGGERTQLAALGRHFDEDWLADYLFRWLTEDGYHVGGIAPDGVWEIVQRSLRLDGGFALSEFETTDLTVTLMIVTADGYLVGRLPDQDTANAAAAAISAVEWETTDPGVAKVSLTADGYLIDRTGFFDPVTSDEWETTDPSVTSIQLTADGYVIPRSGASEPTTNIEWETTDPDVGALLLSAEGLQIAKIPTREPIVADEWETTDLLLKGLLLTRDGYVIARVGDDSQSATAEVVTARGSRPSLGARMSQFLTPAGMPKKAVHGAERLRRTHLKLRSLQLNDPAVQFIWNMGPADSWSQNSARWVTPCADALFALPNAGDAGPGWTGCGTFPGGGPNGNARPSINKMSRAGTWSDALYNTVASPDICAASTTTAGDQYTFSGPDASLITKTTYYWLGSADGVIQYRWNGGTWTQMNVQGVGVQFADLAGVPGAGAWTLEMQCVSGTWQTCGIHQATTARGVRCNKLAGSGSAMSGWATRDPTQWQASWASLGAVDLVSPFLLTNDRSGNRTPQQFYDNYNTVLGRIRGALPAAGSTPLSDILMLMPPQSTEALTYPQSQYVDAVYTLADTWDACFIDFQPIMGPPGTYSDWMEADGRHPKPLAMGRLLTDTILKTVISA